MMSYPGRPPIVPSNMPVQPGMPYAPLGAAQPLLPTIVPMTQMMPSGATMVSAPMHPYRNPNRNKKQTRSSSSRTTISAEPDIHIPPETSSGPSVTVFVGNITERAPDIMIRHILAACGHVSTWKRVQSFGFCEFGSPDAALRAIRLLHEMEIGGKKLVAKVDAKTKIVLDEYKGEKRIKNGTQDDNKEEPDDDYCDDEARKFDQNVKKKIQEILLEYKDEMQKYVPQNEEDKPKTGAEVTEARLQQTQQRLLQLSRTSDASANHNVKIDLDTVDFVDEGKRDLISREIGKFREIMKRQEEEKEVERKRREERDREKEKIRSPSRNDRNDRNDRGGGAVTPESVYSVSSIKSVSPEVMRHSNRHRSSRNSRSKSRTREKDRERDNRDTRDRVRDRGDRNDRDRGGEREREREREREEVPKDRDVPRDKELEEELNDRKKQERIAREKEAAYQERLRGWETRERHKTKEAVKEKEKKRIKEEERRKEAKRLKEFLEDYDDERDDSKYYKGRELQKRLADREREIEMDNRDRQKEIDEIEDLKSKILASESNEPEVEIAKMLKAREDMYRPRLIIDVTEETKRDIQKKKEKERAKKNKDHSEQQVEKKEKMERRYSETEKENKVELVNSRKQLVPYNRSVSPSPPPDNPSPIDDFSLTPEQGLTPPFIPPSVAKVPQPVPNPIQIIISNEKQALLNDKKKKKKLDVKDVFNDEDEENSVVSKKRKLVPLDYNDEKKSKEDGAKSQEEKKKHIKSLIEKIPTDKTNLFLYQLDWSSVDSPFIEKRIRPWINKKIIEYIGEPEPTLVDFICSKVLAGSQPQSILDDVQMVLDEEAEVFVVKMWRLLIYEVEAKRLGLLTTTKNNSN